MVYVFAKCALYAWSMILTDIALVAYSPNYGPSGWHPDDLRKTDLCLAEIGEDTVKLEQFRHDRQRSMEDIKKVRFSFVA